MKRAFWPPVISCMALILLALHPACSVFRRPQFDLAGDAPQTALARVFLQEGFTTGLIFISDLDVEVRLAANQFYRQEAKVANVFARVNQLKTRFGEVPLPYSQAAEHQYGWCGMIELESGGRQAQGFILLVERHLNPPTRRYTIAHEHGHFLWFLGRQELVYRQFSDPGNIARRIDDEEAFAALCGWISLRRAGYELEDFSFRDYDPEGRQKADHTRELVTRFLRRTR